MTFDLRWHSPNILSTKRQVSNGSWCGIYLTSRILCVLLFCHRRRSRVDSKCDCLINAFPVWPRWKSIQNVSLNRWLLSLLCRPKDQVQWPELHATFDCRMEALCRMARLIDLWGELSNLKEPHPLEVAEYAVAQQLEWEPAFDWWVPRTLKKLDAII